MQSMSTDPSREAKNYYEFGPFRLDVAERRLRRGADGMGRESGGWVGRAGVR